MTKQKANNKQTTIDNTYRLSTQKQTQTEKKQHLPKHINKPLSQTSSNYNALQQMVNNQMHTIIGVVFLLLVFALCLFQFVCSCIMLLFLFFLLKSTHKRIYTKIKHNKTTQQTTLTLLTMSQLFSITFVLTQKSHKRNINKTKNNEIVITIQKTNNNKQTTIDNTYCHPPKKQTQNK